MAHQLALRSARRIATASVALLLFSVTSCGGSGAESGCDKMLGTWEIYNAQPLPEWAKPLPKLTVSKTGGAYFSNYQGDTISAVCMGGIQLDLARGSELNYDAASDRIRFVGQQWVRVEGSE